MDSSSIKRKKAIENRLRACGITGYEIKYLPYLDFDAESFAQPYEVGCRIMIFSSLSLAAHNVDDRPAIVNWLKTQGIWQYVSPNEIFFLEGNSNDPRTCADFSWKIEAAYVLSWALGLIPRISSCAAEMSDEEYDEFCANVPLVGDQLAKFLSDLKYIDKAEIIDENLFNELVTTYLRDLYFSGKPNKCTVNATVSFERHKALNWLRRFSGIEEWDETDTST